LRTVEIVDLGRVKNPDFIERMLSGGGLWKSLEKAFSALKRHLESLRFKI